MRHYSAINLGTINNSKHLGFADDATLLLTPGAP